MGWGTPRFIAKSAFTGTANNSGFSIASPNPCSVGDYLLAILVTNKDTITPDAGFTLIRHDTDSANAFSVAVYYRIATSADVNGAASYSWTCSGVTPAPSNMAILAYRDVDPSVTVTAKTLTAGTTNPVSTPSVTSVRPTIVVRGNATRRTTATQHTHSSTGNERHDGGNNGASTSYTQAWYDTGSVVYAPGSQAGISITVSDATSMTDRQGYSIALGAVWRNPPMNTAAVQRAANW